VPEAAVLALVAFRKHDVTSGTLAQLDIEVRSTITHSVTVQKVQQWLEPGVVTPK